MTQLVEEETSRRQPGRWVSVLFVILVASAFGPYIYGGFRTDQPLVYGLVLFTAVFVPWRWLTLPSPAPILPMIFNWSIYAVIAAIGVVQPVQQSLPWLPGSALAGLDNVLLPIAAMLLVVMYVRPDTRERVLRVTCKAIVFFAMVNGVIALLETRRDLAPILQHWWSSSAVNEAGVSATATLAAQYGRYGGLLNHPAEAGLLYGIAACAALYVWRERPGRLYLVLTPIMLGGLVSVSKIFLLVALPIVLWQVLRSRRSKYGLLFVGGFIAIAVLQSGVLSKWRGTGFLGQLFSSTTSDGFLAHYSAGRFGSGSTLGVVISAIWHVSPLIGVGARGAQVAYDNGWVEAMVNAGAIGVTCYTIALFLMVRLARRLDGDEKALAWGLTLIAGIGSLGLPTLTANRSGLLLWLLIGTLATQRSADERHSISRFAPPIAREQWRRERAHAFSKVPAP